MSYQIQVFKCRLVRDGKITVAADDVDCANSAARVLLESLSGLPHEELHAVYLNTRGKVIGVSRVAQGGLSGCGVLAREALRGAILANAAAVVLGHNHPSGDPTPSPDDVEMTRHMMKAGEAVGVTVLDHLVVCPENGRWRSINDVLEIAAVLP
jgi:DNA repair protein RadC